MSLWWKIPLGLAAWETLWWAQRVDERNALYKQAFAASRFLHKPLLVVGAPDLGATRGPGCGDMVVDIRPSSCPNSVVADITQHIPAADNSVVVFVSCVLEYVADLPAALRELRRVAGDQIYNARVQPWTLTAYPLSRGSEDSAFEPDNASTSHRTNMRKQIANLVTVTGLLFGVVGLYLGGAIGLALLAASQILDCVDGAVARWLGTSSCLGKELDWSTDVVLSGAIATRFLPPVLSALCLCLCVILQVRTRTRKTPMRISGRSLVYGLSVAAYLVRPT